MWNYETQYQSSRCLISNLECGGQYGRYLLFSDTELDFRMNDIFGCAVSDYTLIKSRYRTFQKNFALCPRHRYLLCEGYEPKWYCVCYLCCKTMELMQMGARAAIFIGNVPIRKYMYMKIIDTSSNDFLSFLCQLVISVIGTGSITKNRW